MMPARIYTRRGDKGFTSLMTGEQILKTDPRITTLGAVDELSAIIGVARSFSTIQTDSKLQEIQVNLFTIAAEVASLKLRETENNCKLDRPLTHFISLEAHVVTHMEDMIDEFSQKLPPLQNFLLPGGTKASVFLHLARTICRRTERDLVRLSLIVDLNPILIQYLNRLSDFLFVCARHANFAKNIPDEAIKGR